MGRGDAASMHSNGVARYSIRYRDLHVNRASSSILPTLSAAALFFSLAGGRTVAAQDTGIHPTIANDQICESCWIDATKVTTISGPSLLLPAQVKSDHRGRLFMWSQMDPTTVAVYDQTGKKLATIGHEGEGPGEFRSIAAMFVGPGDSLHVYDDALSRVSVFGPENFKLARSARLPLIPWAGGVLRLGPDRVVVNSLVETRRGFGLPLHLVIPEQDSLVRSFGRLTRRVLPGEQGFLTRALATDGDDVVSISRYQYVVEVWDPETGQLLNGFERRPDGFAPRHLHEAVSVRRNIPPVSYVSDARVDSAGRLWVLVQVPSKDWKRHVKVVSRGSEEAAQVDPIGAYNTVVDVIDLKGAVLIATARFDTVYPSWVDSRHVYSYREVSGLVPQASIWSLQLRSP
ncbi:MAG: 6-bladed beta-propeller [Candidatus Palauibacterales bacterium]|nr:6-bladed beta-propeller [Candidatus Palauibacterales bacterium]